MDFIKNQFQRIQQQLSGLTASQKMLTAALVVIMCMTLAYWARYAGTAEMEAILDQPFPKEDIAPITTKLKSKGIDYKLDGTTILVPAERKMEALADLAFAKLLPRNTQTGFDTMAAKLSPWASASEREALYNRGKEITCSQIIGMWDDVQHAEVVLVPVHNRQIGGNVEPNASITITTGGSANPRVVAEAAAHFVSGTLSGLKLSKIKVIVDGKPVRIRDDSPESVAGNAAEHFELKRQNEREVEEKIRSILPDIDGLRVTCFVKLNTNHTRTDKQEVDGSSVIAKPVEEETEETITGDGGGSGEPGANSNVVANGGMEADPAGAASGQGSTQKRERTKLELTKPSQTHTVTVASPGEATVVSASVLVPRSYFMNVLKSMSADGKAPDEQTLEKYATGEMEKMKNAVRGSTGMVAVDATAFVTVDKYVDIFPVATIATVPQGPAVSIPGSIGKYGKEIALGGLALVSLFMLMMMVRKSAPAPAMVAAAAAAVAPGPPIALSAGEAVAGEAGEGNPMLDGMELDEDAVRTQQMLDQVTTMVSDNPDAAATLVQRWLNRD